MYCKCSALIRWHYPLQRRYLFCLTLRSFQNSPSSSMFLPNQEHALTAYLWDCLCFLSLIWHRTHAAPTRFLVMYSFLSAGLLFFISHPQKPGVLVPASSLPLGRLLQCEACLEQQSWWYLGDLCKTGEKQALTMSCQSCMWCPHQQTHFAKTPCALCLAHCTATWPGSTPQRRKNDDGESKYQHTEPLYLSNNHPQFAENHSWQARERLTRFLKFRNALKVIEDRNIYSIKITQKWNPWQQKSCVM